MLSASALRLQIESALSSRIPSALTPAPKLLRPVAATGIAALDEQLDGGLPVGAISELAGPECSGRTSVALAFVAGLTRAARVCAWVDVSDALDPVSAAAAGVDLARLLWVRCGVQPSEQQLPLPDFALPEQYLAPPPIRKGLHGGGFGPHPRTETRGLEHAIPELLGPRCAEPQRRVRREVVSAAAPVPVGSSVRTPQLARAKRTKKPWDRMDQALRATDLLLQAGGFSAIVLDMGGIAPEYARRVPLATWFRWRTTAERTQTSLVLLTQASCAQSSAEVLVRFTIPMRERIEDPGNAPVLMGIEGCAAVDRRRFAGMRKPPQRVHEARWTSPTAWAGRR
jgi:recombination protein RecA